MRGPLVINLGANGCKLGSRNYNLSCSAKMHLVLRGFGIKALLQIENLHITPLYSPNYSRMWKCEQLT